MKHFKLIFMLAMLMSMVASTGEAAFSGYSSLNSVTVENPTPISISSGVFSNSTNATLNVPKGSKSAYQEASYWKEFKEIVEVEGYDSGTDQTFQFMDKDGNVLADGAEWLATDVENDGWDDMVVSGLYVKNNSTESNPTVKLVCTIEEMPEGSTLQCCFPGNCMLWSAVGEHANGPAQYGSSNMQTEWIPASGEPGECKVTFQLFYCKKKTFGSGYNEVAGPTIHVTFRYGMGDADVDETFQFMDKDGNVLADGTEWVVTEVENDGWSDMVPSGLYVKNNSTENNPMVKLVYTIESIPGGSSLQCCFPGNCQIQSTTGNFSNGPAVYNYSNLATKWIPNEGEAGECEVTFQLFYCKPKTFGSGYNEIAGPKVHVTFKYGGMIELPVMTYGDAEYQLPETTAEGQTLTWSVENAAVAEVNGHVLTIKGAGTTTVTATQAGNDGFEAFSREFTLTVNKAPLTITADDCTKEEGEENPQLTVSYEGFVYDDDTSSLTSQPVVTTTATVDSPAGTYPITASGAESANYVFNYVEGTLTILEHELLSHIILEEDFETGATVSQSTPLTLGKGWTTVNSYSGSNYRYNWFNEYCNPTGLSGPTISGAGCAACDAPISGTDGAGPREEILLTPELDLDDTYMLQFSWRANPYVAVEQSKHDLQVRIIINDNLQGAETIFSILDENMLRESGVMVFPINNWDVYTSKIDLSGWKGKKVKIAFVYKMYAATSNQICLDDVLVKQWTPDVTPVPELSIDHWNFGDIYIGEKMYTEVILMTNQGKNGLQVTALDMPQGVGCNTDFANVNLNRYESVQFQFSYTASQVSPNECQVVIHTNGGDVSVALQACKVSLPEDCLLESFEGSFPPAGWKNTGWRGVSQALEGDQSAFTGGDYSVCTLQSPRLDLSDGGKVRFTYFNKYDDDYALENDIELQVSYDGGDNWTTKWISDHQNGLNQLLTEEIDLGIGSDDSYIRWFYPAVETNVEGGFNHSYFTLDRVVLPRVYGADDVPLNATVAKPANNAQNVYPKDVVLEWGPAQFAEGYKLYVGSNAEANNLIDGIDVGNVLKYTIPECDYETTYYWKVVPYNDFGDSKTNNMWTFTTQPQITVMVFPYSETFNDCTDEVPLGWLSITDNEYVNRRWSPNGIYGFEGNSLFTGRMNAGRSSTLLTPEFILPEGKDMCISFVWGDEHPRFLEKDETGILTKQNVEPNNGVSEVVFEVYADGEWHQESYLSENYNGEYKYWRYEKIDLSPYSGKKVQFRWINRALSGRHDGASLDNVHIGLNSSNNVRFNKEGWDAGKVNYNMAVNSGNQFNIINDGTKELTVKKVRFNSNNFQCSILPGDIINPKEYISFNIQFNANDAATTVLDEMTVEFENGYEVTFPVKGVALAKDVLYYGFELNPLDYQWKEDFTMIDVDDAVNYKSNYYLTEIENDGGRYAFTQAKHANENLTAHSGICTLVAAAPDNNSAANDWLISKQICPSEGSTFDFYARNLGTENSVFVGDNDYHSVGVYVSEDGNTKTSDFKVVMSDTQMPYLPENEWNHFTVDLSAYAGKQIYVAVRHTTINANWMAFFDDFTFTGLSLNASVVRPVNNATDVYPKDVVLEWEPAQFAEGYKLYVGSNAEANNLIDGIDVGNVLKYTIPECDYETTYYWKVVPYNDFGDSKTNNMWTFTTQPHIIVMEFPYSETFNDCTNEVPLGWLSITDNEYVNRRWSPNGIYGFEGNSLYTGWMNAGRSSTLFSPEFRIPRGTDAYISFVWGDEHPSSLLIDKSGNLSKQNVEPNNGVSEVIFEVFADGEWHQEAYLSEAYNEDGETKYWRYEKIDLTQYAGKKIQFRWINRALSGAHNGASLDNIYLDGVFEMSNDKIYSENIILRSGRNEKMNIVMENEEPIIMAEFYLQLPEGVTIGTNEDGNIDARLNESRCDQTHTLSVSDDGKGLYHFLCYSNINNPFIGNEGELVLLRLECDENVENGVYQGLIKEILLSDKDKKSIYLNNVTFNIEVRDYLLGDINNNDIINGMDIVEIVDLIMSNTYAIAADLYPAGDPDGVINGMDLVEEVDLVMSQPAVQYYSPMSIMDNGLMMKPAVDSSWHLGVDKASRYILAQMTVELEKGERLIDVVSDKTHTVSWKQTDDNHYVVICYSPMNLPFSDNDELLTFICSGNGKISVSDVTLIDDTKQEFIMVDTNADLATGINERNNDTYSSAIHDLQGRLVSNKETRSRQVTKGIYIRNNKKVVIK